MAKRPPWTANPIRLTGADTPLPGEHTRHRTWPHIEHASASDPIANTVCRCINVAENTSGKIGLYATVRVAEVGLM